jgi:hypothetical protein
MASGSKPETLGAEAEHLLFTAIAVAKLRAFLQVPQVPIPTE